MSRTHPVQPRKERNSKSFTIEIPKTRDRNPLGVFQERRQVMRDRRNRRPKDARRQREQYGEE